MSAQPGAGDFAEREQVCAAFTEDVLQCGQEAILSVALYGSALTSDFRPKISDYNFVVVADPIGLVLLQRLAGRMGKWRRKRIAVPLLLAPRTVESSLDSYPLEFIGMKAAYRMLHGPDFLAPLTLEAAHVRLQCERELKSKMLLFRRAFVETEGSPKRLQLLIARGLPTLTAIFRGLLYLKQGPWEADGGAFDAACEAYLGVPAARMGHLREIRERRSVPGREEIHEEIDRMLDMLQRLALEVERW